MSNKPKGPQAVQFARMQAWCPSCGMRAESLAFEDPMSGEITTFLQGENYIQPEGNLLSKRSVTLFPCGHRFRSARWTTAPVWLFEGEL